MYLRRCRRTRNRKDHIYWELVESYRTARGPRQRVVAYLGDMVEAQRIGVEQAATKGTGWQSRLFDESPEPEWVEIDIRRVRAERVRDFGGYWLGLQASEQLGLIDFLDSMSQGRHTELIRLSQLRESPAPMRLVGIGAPPLVKGAWGIFSYVSSLRAPHFTHNQGRSAL